MAPDAADLDDLFRRTSARIVSTLTRLFGARHLALAEDVAQDALVRALQTWPLSGTPANPAGWLFQVARNRALDVIRRDQKLTGRTDILRELQTEPSESARLRGEPPAAADDRLAMMFLAAHPILSPEARIALTLKTVCGFGTGEIARALLARDDAVAQRLVRARRQLADADVAVELTPAAYRERLPSVLDIVYLLFNEGYAAHAGDDLIRRDLCQEAVELVLLVTADPILATSASHALAALLLLQAARLPARVGEGDDLLLLAEQDRSRWDQALIARGLRHLDRAAAGDEVTAYHIEAGIAAAHTLAPDYAATDWRHIVELYDALFALKPTPVVALNRAVAVSRLRGPAAGLDAIAAIGDAPALRSYYLLPAVRGELHLQLGNVAAAAADFREALRRRCSDPERRLLERRLGCISEPRARG